MASGSTWVSTGNSIYYAARERLESSKAPVLSCPDGDIYTLKAGLITADEVSIAGGLWDGLNDEYYLNTGENYWTMSPYYYYGGWYSMMFYVDSSGIIKCSDVYKSYGVRPVVNLRSDTLFASGGLGTKNAPYEVL